MTFWKRTIIEDEAGESADVNDDGSLNFRLFDQFGNPISDTNPVPVHLPPLISEINSTSTPLAAGSEFVGTAERCNGYGIMYVNSYSDVASATDGLKVEQSSDGTNWDHCDEYSLPAGTGKNFSFNLYGKWYRVRYLNGAADQTQFRLQAILKETGKSSSHRIQDRITDEDDAELVKATLTGMSPSGVFPNVLVSEEGRLQVSSIGEKIEIGLGRVAGYSFIEKFGRNTDVDTPGNEFIWSRGGIWVPPTQARIHALVSTSAADTNTAGTGMRKVSIQGLDANWLPQSETVNMNGITPVNTANSYVIIFRMESAECGSGKVNAGTITATAAVDATVTAEIPLGKGKTLMAIYAVAAGATMVTEQVYAYLNGSVNPSASPQAVVELWSIKNADTATACKAVEHSWGVAQSGSSGARHPFLVGKVFPEKTIIYLQAETVTEDNTDISAGFDGWIVDIPTAPFNTVAPVASGTGEVGETLTTTDGTWAFLPTSYTYQWQSDGVDISGATASTFVLTISEDGTDVRCGVTATNATGSTTAYSNAISVGVELWTPASITTAAWYDAADASTITEETGVSVWADKSTVGTNDATQPTAGRQPIYSAANKTVTFTTAQGYNMIFTSALPFEWWACNVWTLSSSTGFRALLSGGTAGSASLVSPASSMELGSYGGGAFKSCGQSLTSNVEALVSIEANNGSDNEISINGGAATVCADSSAVNNNCIHFGGAQTANQGCGIIRETVVLPTSASVEDKQKVEGYLAWKWDGENGNTALVTALPAGHPYKSAAPTA